VDLLLVGGGQPTMLGNRCTTSAHPPVPGLHWMGLPWQTRLNSSIIDGDACSAAAGRCWRRGSAIGRGWEGFAVVTGFPQRRIV